MCICVCIPILFIHFSVDGNVGCFHTLAIVNNAAVNRGAQIPELLGHVVIPHLTF